MRTLTLFGFFLRFFFALVLAFCTYNPSGYSFYHLAVSFEESSGGLPLMGLFAVLLIIGWTIYIRATIRSLGLAGVLLVVALFGSILWVAIDMGIISLENPTAMSYVILVILSIILAVGMSWSHIRRRISGQTDMDDVDE